MKWDIERSNMLKERIAENEDLMRKLSSVTEEILKKYGIELEGLSYIFEPRVFQMDPEEITEATMKSRAAIDSAVSEDIVVKNSGAVLGRSTADSVYLSRLPYCGPLDPVTLARLEKIRIPNIAVRNSESMILKSTQDPVPAADLAKITRQFMDQIMRRKELLRDFSESVFGVLKEYGIEFAKNEGCVFIPIIFETPIFAQKVAVSKKLPEIHGFGPQVLGTPALQPAVGGEIESFAGVIEYENVQTIGVILPRWVIAGIPRPDMLRVLDIIREVNIRNM